jgi:hypothetical protein
MMDLPLYNSRLEKRHRSRRDLASTFERREKHVGAWHEVEIVISLHAISAKGLTNT